jgi:hypothetical protein
MAEIVLFVLIGLRSRSNPERSTRFFSEADFVL